MGARANYVLIEGDVNSIYYSHWGAMTIPAVVINGPEATRRYIRNIGPPDHTLMDNIWAEGGILLDVDRRALLFFGGENIRFSPPWQRLFLRMMRRIWQGWSIAWAGHGIIDLATYPGVADFLGIDPSTLITRHERIIEQPFVEAKIRNPHQNPWEYTTITVTWEDGRIGDYTFDDALDGYLLLGPNLLELLRKREIDSLPCEEPDEWTLQYDASDIAPSEGAYINTATRVMWVTHDTPPLYSVNLERIALVWSGWHVNEHFEGLGRQVALSGRDPKLVAPPYDKVETEIVGDLMSGHNDNDDSDLRLSSQESATGAWQDSSESGQIVHPAFSAAERREWLIRLLQEALREDSNARNTS